MAFVWSPGVRMKIGPYSLASPLLLAPMAGITDRPFRQLCRSLGAGLAVSEMTAANPLLWHTRKGRMRRRHAGESLPIAVQIAGGDPGMMASAARQNVADGAQIIDINMGCPAKKVCNIMAGSALLRDEALVARILTAVVAAVAVPVTLKIRTGWDPMHRNGVRIARLAEDCGIQALAVHGRTRACAYRGQAEYETIREIKQAVSIPVIANGDIDGPEKAREVLRRTGADALMIGRAAQGNPWIFREIGHFLRTGEQLAAPGADEIVGTMLWHVRQLHDFHGPRHGVRIARKHIGWYLARLGNGEAFWRRINRVDAADEQLQGIQELRAALRLGVRAA